MLPENPSTTPGPMVEHLGQYLETGSSFPETERLGRALQLLASAVALQAETSTRDAFPNNLAAAAGFARARRQIDAAAVLLSYGFYGEVRNLLRSAYESAGLARMLAHEPERAENWLERQTGWPDRKVRAWLEETKLVGDDVESYRNFYKSASAWAHPTALSCLSLFEYSDEVFRLKPEGQLDAAICRLLTAEITVTAIFVCFAFRNACVDEAVLPPQWREGLRDLTQAVTGEDVSHLDRDWDLEEQDYDRLRARVRAADELDETLRSNPQSWFNLKPTGKDPSANET